MRRPVAATLCSVAALWAAVACSCELVLTEHRTGRVAARWTATVQPVRFGISFEHSVLGTTVRDQYEMRPHAGRARAHLVEEVFDGEGYGLPYAALQPGEALTSAVAGSRLVLDRVIDPLVVRTLPAQNARLEFAGRTTRLADLGGQSLAVETQGCNTPSSTSQEPRRVPTP